MNPSLQRILDSLRSAFRTLSDLAVRLTASLRAVDIDPPRAVVLCITFQLLIAITVVIAFRSPAVTPIAPREGELQSQPEPDPIILNGANMSGSLDGSRG